MRGDGVAAGAEHAHGLVGASHEDAGAGLRFGEDYGERQAGAGIDGARLRRGCPHLGARGIDLGECALCTPDANGMLLGSAGGEDQQIALEREGHGVDRFGELRGELEFLLPGGVFHTRAVLSALAEAKSLPSGEKATEVIQPVWALSSAALSGSSSKIRTMASVPPVARRLPSAEKATASISSLAIAGLGERAGIEIEERDRAGSSGDAFGDGEGVPSLPKARRGPGPGMAGLAQIALGDGVPEQHLLVRAGRKSLPSGDNARA